MDFERHEFVYIRGAFQRKYNTPLFHNVLALIVLIFKCALQTTVLFIIFKHSIQSIFSCLQFQINQYDIPHDSLFPKYDNI